MPRYTVIFQHTCPYTTWAEAEPHGRYDAVFAKTRVWGDQAGKPIDHRLFTWIVDAADYLEAERIVRRDAMPGWGTIVYLVFEGALTPLVKSDLVIRLSERSARA